MLAGSRGMDHCCEGKAAALRLLRDRRARTLRIVLFVNAMMFLVEGLAGWTSRSTALLGDALDMFGDAAVYGATLYALERPRAWQGGATIAKGAVMLLFACGVFGEALLKMVRHEVPQPDTMGAVGLLALVANVACAVLLLRHREDDINMRSAWLCSRNDIIANVSVVAAAVAVRFSGSWWPDVIVGAGIAALFLWSATGVLRSGLAELRDRAVRET